MASEVVVSAVVEVDSAAVEVPLEEVASAVDEADPEEASVAEAGASERSTRCTCFSFDRLVFVSSLSVPRAASRLRGTCTIFIHKKRPSADRCARQYHVARSRAVQSVTETGN